ncbi:MAG TPA: hypothetical protein DG048_18795 [Pseudoalteromonas sp.]|nr:hypothetical protein [Pseudoalteromonas sp.]|tara:strand:+ start:451 stop:639 length:189 start_codon:yes stop_codon:yes gene_type:complete
MSDPEKIDNMIRIMIELKELAKKLETYEQDEHYIFPLMLALIVATPIPDVTILPMSREVAFA